LRARCPRLARPLDGLDRTGNASPWRPRSQFVTTIFRGQMHRCMAVEEAAGECSFESGTQVRVLDTSGEQLHVLVAVARTLAGNPQPPVVLRVVIVGEFANALGVLELAGPSGVGSSQTRVVAAAQPTSPVGTSGSCVGSTVPGVSGSAARTAWVRRPAGGGFRGLSRSRGRGLAGSEVPGLP
jgi:hypothetical protein